MNDLVLAVIAAAGVSGAANRLLTAIFHVFGYDPDSHRLITDARSRGKAMLVGVESQARAEAIRRRWAQSMSHFPPNDRHNIGAIFSGSLPHLEEGSDASLVEPDTLRHLVERARLVSDSDMQRLWSKILSGEVNQPGAFSKRTFDLVSSLSKREADNFTRLCSFVVSTEASPVLMVYDLSKEWQSVAGMSYDDVMALKDAGLIRDWTTSLGSNVVIPFKKEKVIGYFGSKIWFHTDKDSVPAGLLGFTAAGAELAGISGASANDRVFRLLVETWSQHGSNPHSRWP